MINESNSVINVKLKNVQYLPKIILNKLVQMTNEKIIE